METRHYLRDLMAGALFVAPVLVCGAAPALAGETGATAAPGRPTKAQIEHSERATLPSRPHLATRPEPARLDPSRQAPDGVSVAVWQLAASGVTGAAVGGLLVAARQRGSLRRDVTVTP